VFTPACDLLWCAVVALCPNDETVRICKAGTWEEVAKLEKVRRCALQQTKCAHAPRAACLAP
jgi:hypothetical protein